MIPYSLSGPIRFVAAPTSRRGLTAHIYNMKQTPNYRIVALWAARIIAAAIMLQTLYFKFSGAEESVFIFSTVGVEPWGRYMVGTMELVASVLLLLPSVSWLGAGL